MGTFTTDELLYIAQEMGCHVDPALVGVQKRTDVTNILRNYIKFHTGGDILANLQQELLMIARRGVASKAPKIKDSQPGTDYKLDTTVVEEVLAMSKDILADPVISASAAAASATDPDEIDAAITAMVAAGTGGAGGGNGDEDDDGDKDDEGDKDDASDDEGYKSEPEGNMLTFVKVPHKEKTHTLSVSPYYTVGTMKYMLKDLEGVPIKDQILKFGVDQLDDQKMLYEIGIMNGSSLMLVTRIKGSGKRGRGEDGKSTAAGIPEIVGEIPPILGDHPAIVAALQIRVINIGAWVGTLGLDAIIKLFAYVDEHSTNIIADPAIRCYAEFTAEMTGLKDAPKFDLENRIFSIFKIEFFDFETRIFRFSKWYLLVLRVGASGGPTSKGRTDGLAGMIGMIG